MWLVALCNGLRCDLGFLHLFTLLLGFVFWVTCFSFCFLVLFFFVFSLLVGFFEESVKACIY